MSEKDKKTLENIAQALSSLPEFDKGYLLGQAEAMAAEKKKAKNTEREREKVG